MCTAFPAVYARTRVNLIVCCVPGVDIRATFEGRTAEMWARERRHDALANMIKDEVCPLLGCTVSC